MVKELREIVFAPAEVLAALRAYRSADSKRLPPGDLVATQFGDEYVAIEIHHRDDLGPTTLSHRLSYDSMRDVLVRYCLENNIPLPRRAAKSVAHSAENLVLNISLEGDVLGGADDPGLGPAPRGPVPGQDTVRPISPRR